MHVEICDVGPRDGLQNAARSLAPSVRAELVNRLGDAGLRNIEAGSFVDARRVPTMAGAEEVAAAIVRRPGVVYSGLVLNERGYDRFRTTDLDEVHVALAATETFNMRNQGRSVEASVIEAASIIARAHADGRVATATIAVAFGCPFEGLVDPRAVIKIAGLLVTADVDAIVLADTIGVAVPRQVRALVDEVAQLGAPIGMHLHNTRNTGIANALAAIEGGVRALDASIGGTGGCPFAPGASGNIATEDLVYVLHGEGIGTGVRLEDLLETSAWLENVLQQRLESQVYRSGDFAPISR